MHDVHVPCVTVFGDFSNPEIIVKKILDCEELPGPVDLKPHKGYPWLIDTKYYKANVNVCPVQYGDNISTKITELTEGLILYFDNKNSSSFDNVTKWVEELDDLCPEILLLVCDSLEGVQRSTVMKWCLENGYELIELCSQEMIDVNDEEDDIIEEKRGFDRIIEALHTHTWSNLEMKGSSQNKPNTISDSNLDTETEEFCELFSQLQGMKESIQSLPAKERRACAEQVVTTFWKAIGGDDDEIEDILNSEPDSS